MSSLHEDRGLVKQLCDETSARVARHRARVERETSWVESERTRLKEQKSTKARLFFEPSEEVRDDESAVSSQ